MSRRLETSVEFNALGPVTVTDGADSLNIGGPKQRTVLAMLIAHAGRPVSNDLIAEAVYGEDLPDRGRRRVQTYVSTLRSIIGDVVVKDGRGWSLRVDRDQIDALRFEDLYESVRDADNLDPESIANVLRDALSLWRGHPYDDIEAHGLLEAEVTRLAELRVAVQAARIDADLAAGRDADLIGEIEALLFAYPYQERFRAQHMTALYRAGRQKEALRSYGQMQSLLVEELGVNPNQELQSLEQRILEQDSSLDVAPRRSIQKRAILVADPGDPLELAR
ncbi:MAG: AfsR/SARP family transcriptional regulator, partial [Actinobacteria bacterium]|nr:AfsR/SARP family transcriptional regulator [Actinomycetota bacterium]